MSDTAESLYEALQPDAEIGPDHHRFKLVKSLTPHMLGQLWQAEDLSVTGNPLVTLLFLKPDLLKQSSFTSGIKKHAALNKQLKNKHIAECYGFFSEKSQLLFLSYEKLDGLTLQAMLEKGHNLKHKQQLGLIRQLAYAIDIGFQKLRTPHGCLDPELVYINRKGGVKLTLFALREALDSITAQLPEPLFYKKCQAPEAFHPEKLTRKADVYAFACIAYELLTGKAPFNANDSEADRVKRELSQPSELDDEQWAEMQKAFATAAEERFANCTEMVKAVFPPEKDNAEETPSSSDAEKPAATPPEPKKEETEEAPKKSLKDKIPKLQFSMPSIPRYVWQILGGLGIFIVGYALGWFISDFLNFKEKDLLNLQVEKQEEAILQLSSSLDAQQMLNDNMRKDLRQKKIDLQLLENEFEETQKQLKNSDPDEPGNQLFKDQIDSKLYGPDMVLLPSGKFRMGDHSGIGDDNEKPVHTVTIDKPFALSRFEITFAEYDLFAEATNRTKPDDAGWGRGNRPVINVSWLDAKAYANWLAVETGQPYRLPTEAEWEYAARSGNLTTYWWGSKFRENIAACADCGSQWDGKQTAPVGSFPANSWGLHDMTGNVDEWVADCYEDNYEQAPSDGSAYNQAACKDRVMRGGSWFEINRLIRPASRYRHPQEATRNSWGFRVALDVQQ